MNRRKFLKLTAKAGLILSIPYDINRFIAETEAAEKFDLAVIHGISPSKITKAAIDAIGGMKKFVSRGDIVVVKPNIGWDRVPEQAANTNPEVVAAVIMLCLDAGAKKVKVFDRTVNDPRRCYKQSGIADAAQKLGVEVSFIDDRKFKDVKINGQVLKSWPIYKDILEADKVINVPIAKHHGLSKLTMSIKNWMGVIGGKRSQIHQSIDESLADFAMLIKPSLTVLDAVKILTGNGPQGGNLRDVKKLDTVIAGVDQVAVDSYGATLFGMKGSQLGYVKMADKLGIGKMDISKLKIKKISI